MLRNAWLAVAATALLALPAAANPGGSPPRIEPTPSTSTPEARETPTVRQEAERLYGIAYEEIARARKDVAAQKAKPAEKRFRKALDWSTRATELDPTYHEAWNLVGYASRKLGKPDDAIAAYHKALELEFDYAPAREYLGEAYLEKGDLTGAREQLRILGRLKSASAEAAELEHAITAWVAANPDAAKASDAAAAAASSAGSAKPVEAAPAAAASDSSGAGKP